MKLRLKKPVTPYYINQAFGQNLNPTYKQLGLKGHNGLDLRSIHGQKVYAAHDGLVVYTGMESREGMGIVIKTLQEFDYKDGTAFFKSGYWHNIYPDGIKVQVGQIVKAGDLIALSNSTGNSTGDHVHFFLKPVVQGEQDWQFENVEQDNGYRGCIDPAPFMERDFYYEFKKEMRFGQTNQDVKALQTVLKEDGIYFGPITGYYGNLTTSAVMDFQIKYQVATFIEIFLPYLRGKKVGPKTLAKLQSLYGV